MFFVQPLSFPRYLTHNAGKNIINIIQKSFVWVMSTPLRSLFPTQNRYTINRKKSMKPSIRLSVKNFFVELSMLICLCLQFPLRLFDIDKKSVGTVPAAYPSVQAFALPLKQDKQRRKPTPILYMQYAFLHPGGHRKHIYTNPTGIYRCLIFHLIKFAKFELKKIRRFK